MLASGSRPPDARPPLGAEPGEDRPLADDVGKDRRTPPLAAGSEARQRAPAMVASSGADEPETFALPRGQFARFGEA